MSLPRHERDAAFVAFVELRQRHLRRVAYAICGDWHQAEDLLQIAFAKLYVAWPRVSADGNPEAYVRRILVRSHIDEGRRPWRRERAGLTATELPSPVELDYTERSALIEACLTLPLMQRKVVLLRHWLGLSIAETSSECGISLSTTKSHSARGLARLEKLLSADHLSAV